MDTTITPARIMLVEDDRGDQKLISSSIRAQKVANDLFIVESGEEALDYLSHDDADHPPPDLILLDLNMPGMGGKEFLRRLKADPRHDTIPVVILTTSDCDRDVVDSYKLHASGYVKKPVRLKEFQEVISAMEQYWFVICRRALQPA